MIALKRVGLTGILTSHARNRTWYCGWSSSSPSGEHRFERSSSEVVDYILTSTSQYHFPAPFFEDYLARPEENDTLNLPLDDDDMSESGRPLRDQ